MYQTLYRKYRPKKLSEIIGQDVITKTFANAISNQQIAHAYLLTGPRGTGKTSLAKIVAKMVNCERLFDNNPCDTCENCKQFNNNQAIDVIEIDAASNNGVDEIRELKSKVNLVPSLGKYKIYIIDEVHMLTTEAFNALLKTLEEPPSFIIFILATTEPHKIPATILSRCQRFDFKKVSVNNIVERLNYIMKEEKINIEEAAVIEIARLADGGLRDAIGMLEQVQDYADQKITIDDVNEINGIIKIDEMQNFISLLIDNKIIDLLNKIDEYNNNGKNLTKFVEELIYYLKNILIYKITPKYFSNDENEKMYKKMANMIDIDVVNDYLLQLNDLMFNGKKTGNYKLLLELFIIKNCKEQKSEIKIESQPEIEVKESKSNVSMNEMDLVKKIRINNTLADFNKKATKEMAELVCNLKEKLLDPENGTLISLILDGEIKAASEKYLIFVFDKEKVSQYFNCEVLKVENIFKKELKKEYKIISTYKKDWEVIKKEFNNKEKKYEYIDEDFDLKKIIKNEVKNADDITNIFGSIVEHK